MRPFVIDEDKLRHEAQQRGKENARKKCLLDLCEEHLNLLSIAAGDPKMIERQKKDHRGELVFKQEKGRAKSAVIETVQAIDRNGQPIFEGGEVGTETLLLYQITSTLVKLLRDEWTYK
jgi:hypothetical protein